MGPSWSWSFGSWINN